MPFALVAPYRAPYRLTRKDGWATSFSDMSELGAVLRATGITLSPDPVDGTWCAFDSDGSLVLHEAVCPESRYSGFGRVWCRFGDQAARAVELGIPVPGTGKRRGGHWFRRPRNVGVRRAQAGDRVDLRDAMGGRMRLGHRPPSDYDDVPISQNGHSWKRSRRTRWRMPG